MMRALALAATLFLVASASAAAGAAAHMGRACRVPRLRGLTLTAARARAAHAGCRLRVSGSAPEDAAVQTVARQSPAGGHGSSSVTVRLNPLCRREAAYAPEIHEPLITPGPTELISGFFLVGGPDDRRFSDPGFKRPAPSPGAGTVEVTSPSGALVATQTSTDGSFVEIPLPPGSYTIRGTFLGAELNYVHPTRTETVVIPPGRSVRQDFFLDIP